MSEPTIGDLLDRYFELGVAEGREGRTHDTIDGAAQETRLKIAAAIARARDEAAKDALQDSPKAQMMGPPADQIIGQIEELFPNWRSYRDLVDCIECTLHELRSNRQ